MQPITSTSRSTATEAGLTPDAIAPAAPAVVGDGGGPAAAAAAVMSLAVAQSPAPAATPPGSPALSDCERFRPSGLPEGADQAHCSRQCRSVSQPPSSTPL